MKRGKELRLGIVIQARTASTRLPKKIISKIDKNVTFLDLLLLNLEKAQGKIPIILATSNKENDDILEEFAGKHNILCYRGSEQNVLERFIGSAEYFKLDTIIRVCSDNPFIDFSLIEKLLNYYKEEDYLSFEINGKPSILTHYGFFTEIVSLKALRQVYNDGNTDCFEHVTNCIYLNDKDFNIRFIEEKIDNENIRCTLDTSEDFKNLKKIYFDWYKKRLKDNFEYTELINYIEDNPDLEESMKTEIKRNSK